MADLDPTAAPFGADTRDVTDANLGGIDLNTTINDIDPNTVIQLAQAGNTTTNLPANVQELTGVKNSMGDYVIFGIPGQAFHSSQTSQHGNDFLIQLPDGTNLLYKDFFLSPTPPIIVPADVNPGDIPPEMRGPQAEQSGFGVVRMDNTWVAGRESLGLPIPQQTQQQTPGTDTQGTPTITIATPPADNQPGVQTTTTANTQTANTNTGDQSAVPPGSQDPTSNTDVGASTPQNLPPFVSSVENLSNEATIFHTTNGNTVTVITPPDGVAVSVPDGNLGGVNHFVNEGGQFVSNQLGSDLVLSPPPSSGNSNVVIIKNYFAQSNPGGVNIMLRGEDGPRNVSHESIVNSINPNAPPVDIPGGNTTLTALSSSTTGQTTTETQVANNTPGNVPNIGDNIILPSQGGVTPGTPVITPSSNTQTANTDTGTNTGSTPGLNPDGDPIDGGVTSFTTYNINGIDEQVHAGSPLANALATGNPAGLTSYGTELFNAIQNINSQGPGGSDTIISTTYRINGVEVQVPAGSSLANALATGNSAGLSANELQLFTSIQNAAGQNNSANNGTTPGTPVITPSSDTQTGDTQIANTNPQTNISNTPAVNPDDDPIDGGLTSFTTYNINGIDEQVHAGSPLANALATGNPSGLSGYGLELFNAINNINNQGPGGSNALISTTIRVNGVDIVVPAGSSLASALASGDTSGLSANELQLFNDIQSFGGQIDGGNNGNTQIASTNPPPFQEIDSVESDAVSDEQIALPEPPFQQPPANETGQPGFSIVQIINGVEVVFGSALYNALLSGDTSGLSFFELQTYFNLVQSGDSETISTINFVFNRNIPDPTPTDLLPGNDSNTSSGSSTTTTNHNCSGSGQCSNITLSNSANDIVTGSGSNETFSFNSTFLQSGDTVNGAGGTDTLFLTAGANTVSVSNIESIQVGTSTSTNTITFEDNTAVTLRDHAASFTTPAPMTLQAGTNGSINITMQDVILNDGSKAVTFNGNSTTTNDSVTLINGADTATFNNINTITDGGGNDNLTITGTQAVTVTGGTGNDTLALNSSGAHTVRYTATNQGGDTVNGFNPATDAFQFDSGSFSGNNGGVVNAANFVSGAGATPADANDFWIFNTTNNQLSYDADGNGGGAAVVIATLDTNTLTSADITFT